MENPNTHKPLVVGSNPSAATINILSNKLRETLFP